MVSKCSAFLANSYHYWEALTLCQIKQQHSSCDAERVTYITSEQSWSGTTKHHIYFSSENWSVCPLHTISTLLHILHKEHGCTSPPKSVICWKTALTMIIKAIYCASACTRYWHTNVLLILPHSCTIFLISLH